MSVLAEAPLGVRQEHTLERPGVGRVERIGLGDARGLQGATDRLEERLAVFLDQGLEERHAEHLAFTFIDAGGEIFVNVFAEGVPAEESAAAVGFHEQLDGCFLLGLAAEDLGDDTLELAAVTLVEQPRAPIHERIAADDQGGQAADAAEDELASDDRGAVGSAESCPGQKVSEHDSHRACRGGAQGHSPQVQAVVGDGEPVALGRAQQVLARARADR